MIKFRDYGGKPVMEAMASPNVSVEEVIVDVTLPRPPPAESEYNVELGVYHENEITCQPIVSPTPAKRSFKNKRKNVNNLQKIFLGIPQEDSVEVSEEKSPDDGEKDKNINSYESLGSETSEDKSVDSKERHSESRTSFQDSKSEEWDNNSDTPDVTIEIADTTITATSNDGDEGNKTINDATSDDGDDGNNTIFDFLGETETIAHDIADENTENEELFNSLLTRAAAGQTWGDAQQPAKGPRS